MPRSLPRVKNKVFTISSPGLVDLHFHGAFGIDLMTAEGPALAKLARKLWSQGVAAFCPTTLSVTHPELLRTVARLGAWIKAGTPADCAVPLGIHLEGPYINPKACGAHPPGVLKAANLEELEELWQASHKTLKILTVAPEILTEPQLRALAAWCRKRKIVLSLGHSRATEKEACLAFQLGFRNVTHAWNAMNFHHRMPGLLGAALGNPKVFLELILDGIHVDPAVLRWTRRIHPAKRLCFVSDCAPAAGLKAGVPTRFGPLRIEFSEGASRLSGSKDMAGTLAGGGYSLAEMYRRWLTAEAKATGDSLPELLRATLPHLTSAPLESLGIPLTRLGKRRVVFKATQSRILSIDSMPLPG